jgi:thiamine biosynthesis protein ThiS
MSDEERIDTMLLTINGDSRTIGAVATVEQLLRALDLDAGTVVVELNRRIIRRPALATTPVADGDQVEIVHFVGGG